MVLLGAAVLCCGTGCKPRIDDTKIVWVDPAQAQAAMTQRQGAFGMGPTPDGVFLDPRTPARFAEGHIPGALNIPLSELNDRFTTLRDYTVIVVYDTDYADELSKATTKALMAKGFKNVRTLRGGLRAWERDGNKVDRGAAP